MRFYPRKNEAADDHRRRMRAAGLLSLFALHEKVSNERVTNIRWSAGRPRPAGTSLGNEIDERGARRSTSNIRNFCRAAYSIEEALGIDHRGVGRSYIYV